MIESRIRFLSTSLESKPSIALVHPYPNSFENVHYCKNVKDIYDAINTGTGGAATPNGSIYTLYTETFYIGLYFRFDNGKMNIFDDKINVFGYFIYFIIIFIGPKPDSINLSKQINAFKSMIWDWADYDDQNMKLNIQILDR